LCHLNSLGDTLMGTILAPVTEAIQIEIIDETGRESHVLLDIQSNDGERARVRVRREHMIRVVSAFTDNVLLHPRPISPIENPSACVVIAATNVDLVIDNMRETAMLALDPGNGLKCMVPLSADLAERLAAVGRLASRYLQSLSRMRAVH
jgi:hypothetical protein